MRGCLAVIVVCLILGALVSMCSGSDSTDCYTTGDPGSAQYQHDLERCLGQ
jgi:hypothetical protein